MKTSILFLNISVLNCSELEVNCDGDNMEVFINGPQFTDCDIISATSKTEECQMVYNDERYHVFSTFSVLKKGLEIPTWNKSFNAVFGFQPS